MHKTAKLVLRIIGASIAIIVVIAILSSLYIILTMHTGDITLGSLWIDTTATRDIVYGVVSISPTETSSYSSSWLRYFVGREVGQITPTYQYIAQVMDILSPGTYAIRYMREPYFTGITGPAYEGIVTFDMTNIQRTPDGSYGWIWAVTDNDLSPIQPL